MNRNGRRMSRKGIARKALSIILLLVILIGAVLSVSAQWPPTWQAPGIVKTADKSEMWYGDQVQFTITVINPSPPDNQATWLDVQITDEIDPAFRIDNVRVEFRRGGSVYDAHKPTNDDNTVSVEVDALAPGESVVITIDCTLVGAGILPGECIENKAVLQFSDPEGDPQPAIESEPVQVCLPHGIFIPQVFRNHTP